MESWELIHLNGFCAVLLCVKVTAAGPSCVSMHMFDSRKPCCSQEDPTDPWGVDLNVEVRGRVVS